MNFSQNFPVNENNEIVLGTGTGSTNVVGNLPMDYIPTDSNGRLVVVGGSSVIYPSGADDTPFLQEVNDRLRNQGGGYIELQPGAKYLINTSLIIDVGTGVGIRGNGAWLDARNITGTNSAIILASRAPSSQVISGVDTNTTNYHGKRIEVEGFTLVGQSTGVQTHHGIDINMSTPSATRSPRPTVRNVTIEGFDRAIRHRNFAYLVTFTSGICNNALKALSMEGGTDQGEQSNFVNWTFGNSDIGLYVDTQPETGTAENVDEIGRASCRERV